MSAIAEHALPRPAWRARLRADIESGDGLIRKVSAEPRAAASKDEPPPQSSAASGAGKGGGDGGERAHRFAKEQLKAFVERIERLAEEKKAISGDIGDVYKELKIAGFDKKAVATVVRLRAQDVNERREQAAILETYLAALGML